MLNKKLVVAMGLCEIADEDLLGEPARAADKDTSQLQDFGYYTDDHGRKQYGVIPVVKRINDYIGEPKNQGFRWIDSSGMPRFDDQYEIADVRDLDRFNNTDDER